MDLTDNRITHALTHSNYRLTIARQKAHLKLKIKNALLYAANGGLFCINAELIGFVELLVRGGQTQAVVCDRNDNPILIKDLPLFLETVLNIYIEVTNSYYKEYEELRRARTVDALTAL